MKRMIWGLSIVLAFASVLLAAEPTSYQFGSFPIPLMVDDAEHGVFVTLFQEVVKRTGERCALNIYPVQRTQKLFADGDLIGFFPASETSAGAKAVKSAPFYSKNNVVFVRKNTPFITKISELEGKIVGVTKGYTYGDEITKNPNITLEYADSDVNNMLKLSKGRIDAFIVEEQSGLKAMTESGVSDVGYDPQQPISSVPIFFAFQNSESGRMLSAKFSAAIAAMQADGALKQILNQSN